MKAAAAGYQRTEVDSVSGFFPEGETGEACPVWSTPALGTEAHCRNCGADLAADPRTAAPAAATFVPTDAGPAAPAETRTINVSKLAEEEYYETVAQEQDEAIKVETSKARDRRSQLRELLIQFSVLLLTFVVATYLVMSWQIIGFNLFVAYFEMYNLILLALGGGAALVGFGLLLGSMREVAPENRGKVWMFFGLAAVTAAIPALGFLKLYPINQVPILFIEIPLILAVVGGFWLSLAREKVGYFAFWLAGVAILTLAPLSIVIGNFVPSLASRTPDYGGPQKMMAALGIIYIAAAFMRMHTVRKMYEEMESFVRSGNLQLKRGNFMPAIDQYDRAIKTAHKISPLTAYTESSTMAGADVEEPWLQKGVAYAKMGMHKEALSTFTTAININKASDAA